MSTTEDPSVAEVPDDLITVKYDAPQLVDYSERTIRSWMKDFPAELPKWSIPGTRELMISRAQLLAFCVTHHKKILEPEEESSPPAGEVSCMCPCALGDREREQLDAGRDVGRGPVRVVSAGGGAGDAGRAAQ